MFGRTNREYATALGIALVALGCGVAFAGEPGARKPGNKIQFSVPADTVQVPDENEARARLSGPIELLDKGNSLSAAVDRPLNLPPASPTSSRVSARMLDRLERQKNWMLNEPEELSSFATAERAMGVREYDLNRALGVRGRTAVDRPVTPPKPTDALPASLDPGRSDSALVSGNFGFPATSGLPPAGRSDPFTGLVSPLTAPSLLPQPYGASGTQTRPSGLMTSGLFPVAEQSRVLPDFLDLLAIRNSVNPLSGSGDPINLDVDSTRRQLNPVTAPSLNDLRAGQRFDSALSLPTTGPTIESRPTVLEEMTARIQGSSSLSPALPTPVEAPKPKFKASTRESFGRKL